MEEKIKVFRQTLGNTHIQREVLCTMDNNRLLIPCLPVWVEVTD